MGKKKFQYDVESVFDVIDKDDAVFAPAKIMIGYVGENRNWSCITEEAFINAPIDNIPVVGKFYEDKQDFGGHDVKVVETKDNYDIYAATVPFGVVPKDAKRWFTEEVVDGITRKCFWTECLLWKRQYGYDHIAQSKTIHHSMEIEADTYVCRDDGYTVIEDMRFTALCLLGEDVEPCFENSRLETFSKQNFDENYKEMLKAFEAYSLTLGNEVNEKMEDNKVSEEEIKETEQTHEANEVSDETSETSVGQIDEDAQNDIDDNVEANTADDTQENTDDTDAEPEIDYALEYSTLKEQYDNLIAEVEELRKFKADVEAKERSVAEEELFTKFKKLEGIDVYSELVSKCKEGNVTLEEFEDKAYSICGRYNICLVEEKTDDKEEAVEHKFTVVEKKDNKVSPYGDAFEVYGNKKG